MTAYLHSHIVDWLCRAARICAIAVIVLALLVLAGWQLNVEALKSLMHPGQIAMNPLTAVCFILAGASLWFLIPTPSDERRRRLGLGLGAVLTAVALVVLIRYPFGSDLRIDLILYRARLAENRMAPNTAITFLLTGISLAFLETRIRGHYWLSQGAVLLAGIVSLLSSIGYFYSIQSAIGFEGYIPMALNTALTFVVLCSGILAARQTQGVSASQFRRDERRIVPRHQRIDVAGQLVALHGL